MNKPYIELYIDGQLVEFENPPQIAITYAHEDLHNPTIVKNSFSKTIKINGTPNNNKIFGCFFDMTRVTAYGDKLSGAYFNPSKRVPFVLLRNGEKVEEGYIKLESVTKNSGKIEYSIVLYGGLGEMLYELSFKEDGEEKRLSDLEYDVDINIPVNKDTVYNAWGHITGHYVNDEIYDTINFAPCYNGLPKDFTTNKVAINAYAMPDEFQLKQYKDNYSAVDGWVLGELPNDMDEIKMKDYRSYLQRPVIRYKKIFEACCNPVNNGGYTVDLDAEFFNQNNPYWEDAWMTLPLLTEVEDLSEETVEVVENNGKYTVTGLTGEDIIKMETPFVITSNIVASSNIKTLKTSYYEGKWESTGFLSWAEVAQYAVNMAIYTQLVAYDANGNVIGGSPAYSFYSTTTNVSNNFSYDLTYPAEIKKIVGEFKRFEGYDFKWAFCPTNVTDLTSYTLTTNNLTYQDGMYFELVTKVAYTNTGKYKDKVGYLWNGNRSYLSDVAVSNSLPITKIVKKGWWIKKESILNSEHTPCKYFLDYLKLFNLHIYKDDLEKKIYIRQRNNYFENTEVDLGNLIDLGSDITITPLTYVNKWYNFSTEYEGDSVLYKDYLDEYGLPFGQLKVDTNYNFDNSQKELFDGNIFKGAIMSRGKSRYYVDILHPTHGTIPMPPFYLDGCQTYLFNSDGDTVEGDYITPKTAEISVNWWLEKYYDRIPRPSFVNENNEPIDGANVLLFYDGATENRDVEGNYLRCNITDDLPVFEKINEGEPCWIYTFNMWDKAGNTVARNIPYFPNFSRYMTVNSVVVHSWDFGTPKTLYVPDYKINDTSNIYTQYWQPFITDRYNVDTRVVECRVLLKERVLGDWLQRFYWWNGCWWVLQSINDYDVTSNNTTKCVFVKIHSKNNYLTI